MTTMLAIEKKVVALYVDTAREHARSIASPHRRRLSRAAASTSSKA